MFKYVLLIYIILLFSLDFVVKADELQCTNNLTATSTLRRLKKDIFCGYDRMVRPARQHNDSINVILTLAIKRLDFDERSDSLTVHSWFRMKWNDYHLVWNPAKYDNISDFSMESYYFWHPDIGHLTAIDEKGFSPFINFVRCEVRSTGKVICAPPINHVAICSADLTYWPFDSHTCDVIFGSWTYTMQELNITVGQLWDGWREYFTENREWLLTSLNYSRITVNICCPNVTYPNAKFTFVLQRHSGVYSATIIFPAIVIMVLTLSTFWMEARYFDRLILALLLVFAHFVFLLHLGNILPSNGDKTPLIVTFYRDSMILATFALLITTLVRSLRSTSKTLPLWASGISNFMLHTRMGQVLIFHGTGSEVISSTSESSGTDGESSVEITATDVVVADWTTLTILVDFISFLVTFLIYFILLIGFIP